MSTPEQRRMRIASPRFYRQYIEENDSLSAAPSPASSLPSTHLRAPSSPFTRSETNEVTARAQPRRSLDIASKALGIRGLTPNTTDAVTQPTSPLLDTRPTLTLHLPNGRVLPCLPPTASNSNPRSRSSSLGQAGSQHVSQAAGTNHNRSASHSISSPAAPIAILHPPRPPYRNASSDPLPSRNPLSSPVITVREPSPSPSESRPPFQSQSGSRNNNIDIGKTGTGRIQQTPEETPASSRRKETSDSSPDALASGGPSPQWSHSRPPLEFRTRSRNHSLDIAAGRRIQQADANAPSPCLETKEPIPGDINAEVSSTSPPAHRSSLESSSGRQSRSHSMELSRTNRIKRPYHRASTQSLQMAKPTLVSMTAKQSSPEANGESARSSLETLTRPCNHSLDLPTNLPRQPHHRASTQSLQTTLKKSSLDTAPITVTRLTPLHSHPPSLITEQEHAGSQSLDTNDHSDPPAVPPWPKHASLPLPSIRPPYQAPTRNAPAAPVTDSELSSSPDADSPPLLFPDPQAPSQAVLPTGSAISTPTVRPPIPPAISVPMMPDYPPPPPPRPQPQPRSEAVFTPRTSSLPVPTLPASPLPTPSTTDQSPSPHVEARQPAPRPSLSNFTTQSLTTLRAATSSISAFQIHSPSTLLSSPGSKSTSNSSSSSATSTSTASVPTPQSPPFSVPSPRNTSDISLTTLTQHVQTQLSRARHLFTSLSHHLTPAENTWIHDTISDTEAAVREILILTESMRVDREVNNGKLGLRTQFKWAVRDSRKAKDKRAKLVLCHESLVTVLMGLQGVQAEYAGNGTGHDTANAEMGPSDGRNLMKSANGRIGGPTTSEPDSPHWSPAVQLQEPGMELVVDEPTGAETRSAVPQSPTPSISKEESIEPAPGKLDNELVDMLSWRWAQGRTEATTTQ